MVHEVIEPAAAVIIQGRLHYDQAASRPQFVCAQRKESLPVLRTLPLKICSCGATAGCWKEVIRNCRRNFAEPLRRIRGPSQMDVTWGKDRFIKRFGQPQKKIRSVLIRSLPRQYSAM